MNLFSKLLSSIAIMFVVVGIMSQCARAETKGVTVLGLAVSALDTTQYASEANICLFKDDSLYRGTASGVGGLFRFDAVLPGQYNVRISRIDLGKSSMSINIGNADTTHLKVVVGRALPKDSLYFSEDDAIRDFNNGIVRLLSAGDKIVPAKRHAKKIAKLEKKYGFARLNLDLNPIFGKNLSDPQKLTQSRWRYNEAVKSLLTPRNGEGWYKKYQAEMIKLIRE